MKVLQIIHTLGHGGAENTFRWLAWGLRRKGVRVIAAIPAHNNAQEENWIAPALDELEVPYITFDTSGTPWQLFRSIANVIGKVRPDIVHSHLLDSNFYSAIACRGRSLPHVCTEHGEVSMQNGAISKVKYALISLCSHFIICVSEAVRVRASKVVLNKRKLKRIYNGIHFIGKNGSSFRQEFNIPPDAVLIGTVGNLYSVKGHKYLIEAFANICFSCPETFLVLVGRGKEEKSLKQLVADLGIPPHRVLFTGFRKDIENIMNALDLYLQPSLSEGHPVALLEAMSLGIPVVATAVGGIPEIIGQDRYGTLIKAMSAEDLQRGVEDYLGSPEKFLEKSTVARNYTREIFSVEKMTCNYIDVYQQVLGWPGK